MSKKTPAIPMGAKVVVSATYERKRDWNTYARTWEAKEIAPRTGWVVGVRHLQHGVATWDSDYGGTWHCKGTIPAVMVAFWPDQNPVPIPPDAYRLATPEDPEPYRAEWTPEERASFARDMATIPRNAKGQWI